MPTAVDGETDHRRTVAATDGAGRAWRGLCLARGVDPGVDDMPAAVWMAVAAFGDDTRA